MGAILWMYDGAWVRRADAPIPDETSRPTAFGVFTLQLLPAAIHGAV